MATESCPRCNAERIGAFRFCRRCAFDFDALPADTSPAPGGTDPVFLSPWFRPVGLVLGLSIGYLLGIETDRGASGVVTVGATIVGGGIGLYIGQVLAMARKDRDL